MFTTFNKVVEASFQLVSYQSGQTGELPLLLWMGWYPVLLSCCLLDFLFFFLQFYIFSCQCFSSSILELLTILVSVILTLSSYTALFYVLVHSPFSQLASFHGNFSQVYVAEPYKNYTKISKYPVTYRCQWMIQIEIEAWTRKENHIFFLAESNSLQGSDGLDFSIVMDKFVQVRCGQTWSKLYVSYIVKHGFTSHLVDVWLSSTRSRASLPVCEKWCI